jgi:hypothetical protein
LKIESENILLFANLTTSQRRSLPSFATAGFSSARSKLLRPIRHATLTEL